MAGIQGYSGAVILSNLQSEHSKAKGIIDFIGNNLQPMNSYMLMRGLKTLALRAEE